MRRFSAFMAVLLCLPALATAQTKEFTVPAGTLLQCTVDEPRFSSQTAQVGDPVLCHLTSLGMFGRPVFPRGAYLSGRLEDFRDPGHFVGKGWLKLQFESLTSPGGTFPLSAKVVSVPHYRVDAEGRIRGHGHPRRDAIEWAIPILWPEKLITLPARGPRPELKGETRLQLRLLEDLSLPTDAPASSAALPFPRSSRLSSSLSSRPSSTPSSTLDPRAGSTISRGPDVNSSTLSLPYPRLRYAGVSIPAAEVNLPSAKPPVEVSRDVLGPANPPIERPWRAPRPTFLIRKDGTGYVVTNYWLDKDQLVYVASDGTQRVLPLEELDFAMTARLNRERAVPLVIRSKPSEP